MQEEQVYEKYCEGKNLEERNQNDFEEYTSFIPREAFISYNSCIASGIATSGDLIFYAAENIMEETQLFIEVGSTERRKVTATPVAENVQCTWKDRNEEPTREKNGPDGILIGRHAKVELSCTRGNFKRNTLIKISAPNTTNPAITLNWPKFVRVDDDYEPEYVMEDMRSNIENLKESMESQNRMLRAELEKLQNSAIRIESGEIHIHGIEEERHIGDYFPNLWDGLDDRGEEKGRVNFEHSFSSTPKVVMAISHLDFDSEKNTRLTVKLGDIDQNGFAYKFITWDDSKLARARAVWLAYGK